ncbi:MAG: hypothetical protein Q7S75_02750 [bacterium]|nr:hypothetical protein [bacterium]
MNSEKKTKLARLIFALLAVALAVWFYTPAPTTVARYVWEKYRASTLALALDRTDAQFAFDIGNHAFGQGSYNIPLAERAFRKSVAIDQEILYGHYQLARVLFVEEKFSEAAVEIDSELAHNPGNLRALYVRGLIRAYSKDLAGAASDFERFTEWAPSEWAGYNDLAWVLGQEGKYAEAKTALEKGLKDAIGAKNNPWLWNNLGVQQLNLEEYQEAVASFKKAKALAAKLTEQEWKSAYPGNNPSGSTRGIRVFREAIETNLERARSKSLQ